MRLVFAGTPEFARRSLAALLDAGHHIALVLTQPDRPAGRGLHELPSEVKRFARERGLEVWQPRTLKDDTVVARIGAVGADAMVVAAYGLILPGALLRVTPLGALNIHASLLPRWRGAAPIQRALLAGDRETGISIMRMDEGLDTGDVLSQRALEIGCDDDSGILHDRLAALGADMIVEALRALQSGEARFRPQPEEGATYAHKLVKAETGIDWQRTAIDIDRLVRALRPLPGARASIRGESLKVWRAAVEPGSGSPGTILDVRRDAIVVACGADALAVRELQRAGGRRLAAEELLRGWPLAVGERFESTS